MKKELTSPRRQNNRNAAIQKILDAARQIMREEGVAALSMQELARRLEMRAPSLYNYFSSKMDLYDSLFRLGISIYKERLNGLPDGAGLRETIRQNMEAYLAFALENPELYQLCFERPVPGFVPSEESLAYSTGILGAYYARIASYRDQISAALTDEQIVHIIAAATHGITALHLANEPHLPMGSGRFGSLIPVALIAIESLLQHQGEIL